MIAYFDSSALVKLLVDEPGSGDVAELWDGADAVLSSRVAHAEVRAALAASWRAHRLSDQQLADAKSAWTAYWDALRIVEVTVELGHRSGDLAEAHALSGFDAVHLASALVFPPQDVIVATWDARLHTAANATAFSTLPAAL